MADSESESDNFILGAAAAGAWAGMLGFKREPKLNVSHKATLWGFYVEPAYRNRGIG